MCSHPYQASQWISKKKCRLKNLGRFFSSPAGLPDRPGPSRGRDRRLRTMAAQCCVHHAVEDIQQGRHGSRRPWLPRGRRSNRAITKIQVFSHRTNYWGFHGLPLFLGGFPSLRQPHMVNLAGLVILIFTIIYIYIYVHMYANISGNNLINIQPSGLSRGCC